MGVGYSPDMLEDLLPQVLHKLGAWMFLMELLVTRARLRKCDRILE